MNSHLLMWAKGLAAAKEAAKAAGIIDGDAALSAIISEKLKSAGLKGVDRGAVNHWLKGRRLPNVPQFIAMCEALGVDPSEILPALKGKNKVFVLTAKEPEPPRWSGVISHEYDEIFTQILNATPEKRKLALAVAKTALDSNDTPERTTRRKQPA